jgi:putative membrane protein
MKIIQNLVFTSLFLAAGFAGAAQETSTFQNKPNVPAPTKQNAVLMTDPQIIGVFHAINQIEIDTAKLAEKKSPKTAPDAEHTAQQVQRDHEGFELALKNAEKKNQLTVANSDLQQKLLNDSKQKLAQLEKLDGDHFVQEYYRHEVEFHTMAMDIFSNQLIPNAKNPELKTILDKGLDALKMHYQKAGTDMNLKATKAAKKGQK